MYYCTKMPDHSDALKYVRFYINVQIFRFSKKLLFERENCSSSVFLLKQEGCYIMFCILCLKSTHKDSLYKTNKYQLIDATLTPDNQI